MVARSELLAHLNELLNIAQYKDYCPNGLQVQGSDTIRKIVSGVTACEALIDQAIAQNADTLLVHHGYFWQGEDKPIVGMLHQRIKKCVMHDINILAYHLPLDGHQTLGNNAQLAKRLNIEIIDELNTGSKPAIAFKGILSESMNVAAFQHNVAQALEREPLVIEGGNHPIKTIGFCTGGAQDFIQQAAMQGCDAYLSGEISERTFHMARELGIHYIAAGHHATERYGVQALGAHLAHQFDVEHVFIDIHNPV